MIQLKEQVLRNITQWQKYSDISINGVSDVQSQGVVRFLSLMRSLT